MAGESGNDTLFGNEGNDLLLGGTGADGLYGHDGNDGNDILVGGSGIDVVDGMDGEDIAIGGLASFGDDVATIQMQDWLIIWSNWSNSNLPYASRVTAMSATTNALALIPGSSVLDDFVSDQLIGAADLDWFFLIGGNGVQTPTSVALRHDEHARHLRCTIE
ncbi:MAG: hypothetical protein O2931_09520 [Planctomycetota bacterium]|nr:hypothetical protein [Planctomycetota bacterium]MDA1179021.1 hypothetical protein [Planctomycetota bacterium]